MRRARGCVLTFTSTPGSGMLGPVDAVLHRGRAGRCRRPGAWARSPCSASAAMAASHALGVDVREDRAAHRASRVSPAPAAAARRWRLERVQDPRGRHGQLVEADADGMEDGVADGRHHADQRRLADGLGRVRVVRVLALDVEGLDQRRLQRGRHPVLVDIRCSAARRSCRPSPAPRRARSRAP